MERTLLVFLYFFLLITPLLRSQDIIADEKEISYTEVFTSATGNAPVKAVLSEIARSQGKIGSALELRYSYIMRQRLIKIDSLHYRVEPELKQMQIAGDVKYRALDASEVLVPDAYSGRILVYRVGQTNGNKIKTVIDTLSIQQMPLLNKMGYFPVDPLYFSDTLKNGHYELQFIDLKLSFSEKIAQAFADFRSTCDEYYNTIPRIDQLIQKTALVDIDSVDFIQFSDVELREIETELKLIESAGYPMKLNLYQYDPAGYTQAIEKLHGDVAKKRSTLNALLTSVDVLYYEKAMKYFLVNDTKKAMKYFEKSLVLNSFFAASQFRMSEMVYRQGLTDSASVMLRKMYRMTFTDPSLESESQTFCKSVYQTLLNEGKTLIGRGEFYEAIVRLEHARQLCDSSKSPFCDESGIRMLSESYYGVYESYLTIAGKAIDNERYEIAETYITQSIDYQKGHSRYIITASPSFDLLQKLSDSYSRAVTRLIVACRFEQALVKADRIDSLKVHFPEVKINADLPELRNRITRGVINEKLDKAAYSIEKKNFEAAGNILSDARKYIQSGNTPSDSARWFSLWVKVKQQEYNNYTEQAWKIAKKKGYTKETYRSCLLPARKLEYALPIQGWDSLLFYAAPFAKEEVYLQWQNALSLISAGDSTGAFMAVQKAELQSELWMFRQSDSVVKYRETFARLDFQRRCEKHKYRYTLAIAKAREKMDEMKFDEAIDMLEGLKSWSLKNIECGIDDKEIYSLIAYAKPAAEYMALVSQSFEGAKTGVFSVCINSFTEAENLYTRSGLSGFGIKPLTTAAHFNAIEDDIIVYRAADYMIDSKRFEDALNILRILQKRGFSTSLTAELQEKLGQKLAVRDRIANPDMNYKVEVLKYSDGEEYFRTLVKNYCRTWKKISR